MMTGALAAVKTLKAHGLKLVFGIPGRPGGRYSESNNTVNLGAEKL